MAEEFHGGVSCGENWWNLPNNLFGSSPCSLETNDMASFVWPDHDTIITAIKPTRSTEDSAGFSSSASPENNSNQDFFRDIRKSEDNYSNIVSPLDSSMNNFGGDFLNNSSKQVNGNNYPLQQQQLNSIERVSTGLIPLDYTSSLLQSLFDTDEPDNNSNYDQINISNEFLPGNNQMPFTINEPAMWMTNIVADFLPSTQSPFLSSPLSDKKRNFPNVPVKNKIEGTEKAGDEPAGKRARIQTPSQLPTFKVRKEKLGDRVTALQQLVSPFGKTDTASVLHEAIEYIKYLHDQVGVFSTPYLNNKYPPLQNLQADDKVKQDLRSRGLCLVPISSTSLVSEITTDFWTPIFGNSFK